MKQRDVIFSPEAAADLQNIYDWISIKASHDIAYNYITRLEKFCTTLTLGSERGHLRDDIRPNLRIVGFEKRITIAIHVCDNSVFILRLFYGGQNWENLLNDKS